MLVDHVTISEKENQFMGKVSPFIAAVVIAIIAMLTINAHAQTFSIDRGQHHGSPVLTHPPATPSATTINSKV
jgi:Ca2+/H+ antiporter